MKKLRAECKPSGVVFTKEIEDVLERWTKGEFLDVTDQGDAAEARIFLCVSMFPTSIEDAFVACSESKSLRI